jgi:hypothetical protein
MISAKAIQIAADVKGPRPRLAIRTRVLSDIAAPSANVERRASKPLHNWVM